MRFASETEQFISRDPAVGVTGQPYVYAGGNPVNATNPTGRFPFLLIGIIALGIGSGVALDVGIDYATNPNTFSLGESIGSSLADPLTFVGAIPGPGQAAKVGKGIRRISKFGKLAGREISVSQKGLGIVEKHLAQFDDVPENTAMVGRLRSLLARGEKATGADAAFYLHELTEATMMGRSIGYDVAHRAALRKYGVMQEVLYHPSVVQSLPGYFSNSYRRFWGLQR